MPSSRIPTVAGKRPPGARGLLRLVVAGIMIIPILAGGCSHLDAGYAARALTREADDAFNRGDYAAAVAIYARIIANHPAAADRALFEMGIAHAYPRNAHKDYRQALDCFERLVRDYPESDYGHDSRMMILQLHHTILKDEVIAAQQAKLARTEETLARQTEELARRQATIAALEATVVALRTAPADKVLIEKQARRLTLFARGQVIKTYPIALGGNPVGPKERAGDNKTPEGTYTIDGRNDDSAYHLALHISYPNAQDKRRARQLGVAPGGDIMIHGIKNGFAPLGAAHAARDWTEGCIAVTNQEMEEIYRLVPDGTIVEITP